MRSGDVALRLSIVFWLAGFVALAASLYEVDRRGKSSSGTAAANIAEIEQRVQTLSNQIRILNNQDTTQLTTSERHFQALSSQIHTLDLRLKDLEDNLRVRQFESAPVQR